MDVESPRLRIPETAIQVVLNRNFPIEMCRHCCQPQHRGVSPVEGK